MKITVMTSPTAERYVEIKVQIKESADDYFVPIKKKSIQSSGLFDR
jgi:hypothetical protein